MIFNDEEKNSINDFLIKVKSSQINGVSKLEDLWLLSDSKSRIIINKIINLDPHIFGFSGPKLTLDSVPKDIVKIAGSNSTNSGEYSFDANAYLPKHVYLRFESMNNKFKLKYPNRQLKVGSGYRSPAFQIITLLYILSKFYDFDINNTLKRVALPGYSQHCSSTNTAVDVLNIDDKPSDENPQDFSSTIEYHWLKENASEFDFNESYPPDNKDGIMWEPWHWQYVGN